LIGDPFHVTQQASHLALHRFIEAVWEAVWRIESARVIAGLTRLTRGLDLAEDLAQEALVAALEQWPRSGVPDNPAAWLTATAKRRGTDGAIS
jgi:predicted RNA polymerase sigma factor